MVPGFDQTGNFPPGIHWITWKDLVSALAFTPRRVRLLTGLKEAVVLLKSAGCHTVYVDGSFASRKSEPGDFDACRAVDAVNVDKLDAVFLDFSQSRSRQKARFFGEFFPAELPEGLSEPSWNSSRWTRKRVLKKASWH
jgi:hypothetical protein